METNVPQPPRLVGKLWEQAAREVQDFLHKLRLDSVHVITPAVTELDERTDLTGKGDLLTSDGSGPVTQAVGTDNTIPLADSTQTNGWFWSSITNILSKVITTKGDLLGYSTLPARIPVGTDGKVLTADSGQALGVAWSAAGTSTLTTKGDILTRDGSGLVRLPVGSDYKLLEADSAQSDGIGWSALTTILGRSLLPTPGFIANSGVTPTFRGIGAAQAGNLFWNDSREATRIGAGDSPNMPGWPWLGFWLRDSSLTNNVAFEVFRVAMPTDSDLWSGHIEYTAVGSDGTDQHQEVGGLRVSAIRDSASVVAAQVGTPYGTLAHLPLGTLTITWSAAPSGSDAVFSCKINSSIAADVWLYFRLQADNNSQTVTFVQT